jgi:hypothetical protein
MSAPEPFIPIWLDDLGLSPGPFRVLCHLWRKRNRKTGQCNPSLESIARACGFKKPDTVSGYLTELRDRGLVSWRKAKFAGSNHYKLLVPIPPSNGVIDETNIPVERGINTPVEWGINTPAERGRKVLQGRETKEAFNQAGPAAPTSAGSERFIALCLSIQSNPDQLTKPERSKVASALAEITTASPEVTPEEIHRRAKNYPSHFRNAALTAKALAAHWSLCERQKPDASAPWQRGQDIKIATHYDAKDGPEGWRDWPCYRESVFGDPDHEWFTKDWLKISKESRRAMLVQNGFPEDWEKRKGPTLNC